MKKYQWENINEKYQRKNINGKKFMKKIMKKCQRRTINEKIPMEKYLWKNVNEKNTDDLSKIENLLNKNLKLHFLRKKGTLGDWSSFL